mgnify:CR=1
RLLEPNGSTGLPQFPTAARRRSSNMTGRRVEANAVSATVHALITEQGV